MTVAFSKYKKYINKETLPILFFIGGFLFDVVTLDRIDRAWIWIQQGSFIVLACTLLFFHERLEIRIHWKPWLQKIWSYHEYALQFMMGSLLSAYAIFYFKSASTGAVISFVLVLVMLMFFNEKRGLHQSRFPIRHAMMSLCICSYFGYLLPILFGKINGLIFAISIFSSILVYFFWMKILIPQTLWKTKRSLMKIMVGIFVPVVLFGLYHLKLIPPVPLSTLKMGIYHDIQKKEDSYLLYYNRPWYWFWQRGDQTFYAKQGDRIYFFSSIFAPTGLKHKIFVRWQIKENQGWQTSDTIPIDIKGGRYLGFRGMTFKENYSFGQWRVLLETEDGRELGRITFFVTPETRSSPTLKQEIY